MASPENSRIEKAFQSYRNDVISPGAPEIQVLECRRAFFAGAGAIFGIMLHGMEPGEETTPADMDLMAGLSAELEGFLLHVLAGEA